MGPKQFRQSHFHLYFHFQNDSFCTFFTHTHTHTNFFVLSEVTFRRTFAEEATDCANRLWNLPTSDTQLLYSFTELPIFILTSHSEKQIKTMLELVLYHYKYKDLLIITSKSDNIIMKKSSTKTPLEHVPNLQRQIGIRRIEVFPLGHLFSLCI